MEKFKKVEITSNDVIQDAAKSIMDYIVEARKAALHERIIANTLIINKNFAKVNDFCFAFNGELLYIPPMICGLEVHVTDELPDGYDFAVVEATETERERIVRQAKSEVAREIFEEIKICMECEYMSHLKAYDYTLLTRIEELKKKYTEKYDRINLTVPKGDKERIHAYALSMGKSVNAYINDLIKADMNK